MDEQKEKNAEGSPKIPIKYKESSNYQIFHADGAFGNWTPKTNLSIDFYVERSAMPEVLVHEITEKGRLGDIVEQRGERGIRRERQLGIIMQPHAVVELRDWLNDKIKEAEEAGLIKINDDNKK